MNPVAKTNSACEPFSVQLAGTPAEIGGMWGRINREPIRHDMEAFFLKPARDVSLSEGALIEQSKRFIEIVEQIAPHWLEESAAIAVAAGVDPRLYVAFVAGIYRSLFLHAECTSYAVQSAITRDHAIFFHKNRDNVDKSQCAFVMNSRVPGVHRFIANSDASAIACMMMVNEKGLAGSADYPGGLMPEKAPPRYRGITNPLLLRHIAERAEDCAAALAIIREFVDCGHYAGGDVNETHWLFVDRTGTILQVGNNDRKVLAQRHTDKVYFSRLRDSSAARRLGEAERPVDFALFHGVSRDPSICIDTSISGMTVEIDIARPDLFSCAWMSLPARSASFPLLMGQRRTPLCLINGEAYRLGKATGDHHALWESIEGGVHAGKSLLKECAKKPEFTSGSQRASTIIEQWSEAQSTAMLRVLQALQPP